MTAVQRGLLLLLLHLGLALAVLGRFSYDRAALPRVWARTVPWDPSDPFRGRYVRLWLDADDQRSAADSLATVEFAVVGERLVVRPAHGWSGLRVREPAPPGARGVVVWEPVAFFIAEHAPDPSVLAAGQTLWVEVTVPPQGLPRPIRLEVRTDADQP